MQAIRDSDTCVFYKPGFTRRYAVATVNVNTRGGAYAAGPFPEPDREIEIIGDHEMFMHLCFFMETGTIMPHYDTSLSKEENSLHWKKLTLEADKASMTELLSLLDSHSNYDAYLWKFNIYETLAAARQAKNKILARDDSRDILHCNLAVRGYTCEDSLLGRPTNINIEVTDQWIITNYEDDQFGHENITYVPSNGYYVLDRFILEYRHFEDIEDIRHCVETSMGY